MFVSDTDQEIQEKPCRAEQKGERQAGNYQQMRNSTSSGIAHLPSSYEQIESQVMHPTSEQQPAILEECADTGQCLKVSATSDKMTDQQSGIYDREQQWQHRARHHHGSRPTGPAPKDQQQPTKNGEGIGQ